MRIINFDIDAKEIQIVPLADLHIGSPECDQELIKEVCDYIAKTPNCYTILNGDICDNVTKTSVGNVFEETMSPQSQVATACYYLQDIAKQKKIINMVVGNHERRGLDDGLTISDLLLAHLLKYDETLNDRYCEDGAFTFLSLKDTRSQTVGKTVFTVFNLHGTGGGAKIGGKVQRLDDMQQVFPTASLYIRSHTHQVETHRGVYFDVNTHTRSVREQPCVFVSTGSFLKYGGYGARAGMKPLSRGIPLITLKIIRRHRHGKEEYYRSVECVIKDHLEE